MYGQISGGIKLGPWNILYLNFTVTMPSKKCTTWWVYCAVEQIGWYGQTPVYFYDASSSTKSLTNPPLRRANLNEDA